MSASTHSRNSSVDRPPRSNSSVCATPTVSRPGVLEISLDRPNPLHPRSIAPPHLFDLLNVSTSLLPTNVIKSEAASPLPKPDEKPIRRHKTHFEDEAEGNSGGEDSLISSEEEEPISRKMRALGGPKAPRRQTTTVLMKSPPKASVPQAQFTFSDDFSPESVPAPEGTPKRAQTTKRPSLAGSSNGGDPPSVFEKVTEGEKACEKVQKSSDELMKARTEVQKAKADLLEERAKVQRVNDALAAFEKLLASKDADIQRLKAEADAARREAMTLKLKQDSLQREIESLKDVEKQLKEEMELRQRDYQAQARTKQEQSQESQEADRLREELREALQSAAQLEADVQHWKRRANLSEGDETSANAKLETYLRELSGLKVLVTTFENKNKEQAAAYKALQKEYSALLEERNQPRNSPASPAFRVNNDVRSFEPEVRPTPPRSPVSEGKSGLLSFSHKGKLTDSYIQVATVEPNFSQTSVSQPTAETILPQRPKLPEPRPSTPEAVSRPSSETQKGNSLVASVRNTSAQMLAALQLKFSKLQSDRDTLQRALSSIVDAESVQARGKKHALEMELGMINSTMVMLSEKIDRYRKSVG